jgi:hypothetical protein
MEFTAPTTCRTMFSVVSANKCPNYFFNIYIYIFFGNQEEVRSHDNVPDNRRMYL